MANKLQELTIKFKDAKEAYKIAKERMNKYQIELFGEMQKSEFDSLEVKDVGRATIVYKDFYIYSAETQEVIMGIESDISKLKDQKEIIKKDALESGSASKTKSFSYIKFSNKK